MGGMETTRAVAREQVLVAMLGIPRLLAHPAWRAADPTEGRGLIDRGQEHEELVVVRADAA